VRDKHEQRTLILIAAVAVARLIYALVLPIWPQEAYYWAYSQNPALSYFDHPPMAAWMIWLGTTIFGDNAFGIRFMAAVCGAAFTWVGFVWGRSLFNSTIGFWFAVALNAVTILSLAFVVITPDTPLLLFTILTLYLVSLLYQGRDVRLWYLVGVTAGLAILSKYTSAMLFLSVAGMLVFVTTFRKHLLKPQPYIAVLIALLVAMPVFIWNAEHDWASFAFQSSGRFARARVNVIGFVRFFVVQLAVVGPLTFAICIAALSRCGPVGFERGDRRFVVLLLGAAPTLLFFTAASAFMYVKMNWPIAAYPPALLAATAFYFGAEDRETRLSRMRRKVFGRLSAQVVLGLAVLTTAGVYIAAPLPFVPMPQQADLSTGFPELAKKIDPALESAEPPVIIGWEYKTAAMLQYHLAGQPQTCSNNMVGKPGLQYDFWCEPKEFIGRHALFVVDTRKRPPTMGIVSDHFEKVLGPEVVEAKRAGRLITRFEIYRAYGYRGLAADRDSETPQATR